MKHLCSGGLWRGGLIICSIVAGAACQKSEENAGPPATDGRAAEIIDLTRFPLAAGANDRPARSLATLTYEVSQGDVKTVWETEKGKLKANGWKEVITDTSATDQAATGTFRKQGFVLSLSVLSASPPKITVSIVNHGNVNYDRLPRPAGMKPIYVGAVSAIYVTDAAVPDTKQAVRKLLTEAGWQPYGEAGDTAWYKQNAVRVSASVAAAPAQGNKTAVSYSSELLSADLPLPDQANDVRYADTTTELSFATQTEKDVVVAFYKNALGTRQWASTLEKTVDVDDKPTMIFRSPAKDLITLSFGSPRDGQRAVSVQFQSAAEIAEIEKRIRAKLSPTPH